jgi:DNA-binding NtrC family response regulator
VGGTKPVKVDVRLIATSNRNLGEAVAAGRFRQDLYFRLNVVALLIPPLRERPADIGLLAEHFAARLAKENGLPAKPLSAEARRMLLAYPWPGNVRELENTMHRAVLLAGGDEIGSEAIDLHAVGDSSEGRRAAAAGTAPVGSTLAEVERDLILSTLSHCLGNRTHAATILGISIRTMRNKLRQYSEEGYAIAAPGQGLRLSA